jgi:hypothetical protein
MERWSVVCTDLQESVKRIKVEEIGKRETENNIVFVLQVRKPWSCPAGRFGANKRKKTAQTYSAIRSCRMCTKQLA